MAVPDSIPTVALCECGCGNPAPITVKTSRSQGYTKGLPHRFIVGHSTKKKPCSDYRRTKVNGVLLKMHRLRAEKALGKPLPVGAVVHHADGSKNEHAPLVICQDQAYHLLLHRRARVVRAGGNPNTEKICGVCRRVLPFDAFSRHKNKTAGRHNTCRKCRHATEYA